MKHKLKITAESVEALRAYLEGGNVDLGCRPLARREGDRVSAQIIAEEAEIVRLTSLRGSSVTVEVLEPVPPDETRSAMVPTGNRFLTGEMPKGFGLKE